MMGRGYQHAHSSAQTARCSISACVLKRRQRAPTEAAPLLPLNAPPPGAHPRLNG